MGPGEEAQNLTGVWQGRYSYGWGDVEFTASLLHAGRNLTGTVHEPDIFGDSSGYLLYALIDGDCEGATVRFSKTYDGTGGWTHSVLYEGALSDAGHRIAGTWTIPGEGEGGFVMTRPRRSKARAVRKAGETVRG